MTLSAVRVLAAYFLVFIIIHPAGAAERPSGPVRKLNRALLQAMQGADALGFEGRYKLLAPVLTRVFTFPDMARVSVGRNWHQLSPAQRGRLTDAFAKSSIATFAARFDGYSGERFEVTGERPGLRGAVIVDNRIVKPSGEIVPINYLLRKLDGKWRIVDVFLKARYSELAIKRSEYRSIIKRGGVETLIRKLNEKTIRMKSNGGG